VVGGLLGVPAVRAQAPSTDIFTVLVNGTDVGDPARVTDREGYDNQPCFLPDGRRMVYSSIGAHGADIRIHDLRSGHDRMLLQTPESEYSPTPIPGQNAISVVRDYGDLKQQLWRLSLDGERQDLLLPDVNPVGYHAWIDQDTVLLYVLGDPVTLQRARIGAGPGTVLARSPGHTLARIPDKTEMSFVDKSDEATWWLTAIDPGTGVMRRLAPTRPGREDYAWAPDGAVWMGDGSRLYRRLPDDAEWAQVADLKADGVDGITRLAFSPDGEVLAVVSARPAAGDPPPEGQ
ncbi:MAG: TolB family protein, partial [Acidobacteriota bacterium]